jgi:two-component system CheB/CheR fusion protein
MEGTFSSIIQQVSEFAIFTLDAEGIPTSWNAGVERVLGYTKEEFIGHNMLHKLFTPEDVESGIPERELALAREHGRSMNDRWMVRNGGVRFYAGGITSSLYNDKGEWIGFVKILRDQTHQRLIEERLQESEQSLRMALGAARMGTWKYIPGENALFMDEHLLGMFGISAAAQPFVIEDLLSVVDATDRERVGAQIVKAVTEHGPMDSEFKLTLRGDHVRWVKIQGDHRIDVNGRDVITGACVDITGRRAAEAALQTASRRKDEFLATLAHELRNPLAPIRNGLQILEIAEDDREISKATRQMMERQLEHMVRLINDLMDLSRISRGTVELRKEQIDLRKILEQAIEACQPILEKAGHEFTVTIGPDEVSLEADPVRLVQVFSNLLNNAAKYTEKGGHITLTTAVENGMAVIGISDDGVGIPPERLSDIFEMFAQVDRSLERSQTGLGIGLNIVKRLIEMHGGRVEVYSEGIGKGSRFMVYLPTITELVGEDRSGSLKG